MGDKERIEEFSRMLDRLVGGEDVSAGEGFDPGMVDVARMLATADLADLSRGRETLRHRLGQQRAANQTVTMDSRPKRGIPLLAAFSMGFATIVVVVLAGLVLLLPLAQHFIPGNSIARESNATLTAFLAANPHSPSPIETASLSSWLPPEHVDHAITVSGEVGTVQQLTSSLPSEDGLMSHVLQVTVDIPPVDGDGGYRFVEYSMSCSGMGAENLRWGWWGQSPTNLACGLTARSDSLSWDNNAVYFVVEVPLDGTATVTYTLTVKVSEYSQ
jgi:hypothetical protein